VVASNLELWLVEVAYQLERQVGILLLAAMAQFMLLVVFTGMSHDLTRTTHGMAQVTLVLEQKYTH
jgi:hypothetical protein